MTDIVERLKDAENATHALFNYIFQDAREEIERLRVENEALRTEVIHTKEVEFPRKAQAVADGWRGKCERLEAKIVEMEQQEPVRWGCTVLQVDGSWKEEIGIEEPPKDYFSIRNAFPLYALPGAQPAPSVPEGVSFIDTSQLEGVVSTVIGHAYLPPSGWLRAIDEALVVTHLGVANAHDTYEQAKAKLDSLIGFHVDVATDPAVNGGWKLMPVEPTEEVYQCFSAYDGTSYSNPFDRDEFLKDWRAALAAVPEAKP